jgi:hypothetical protein
MAYKIQYLEKQLAHTRVEIKASGFFCVEKKLILTVGL